MSSEERSKRKTKKELENSIAELIQTEEEYVQNMAKVVECYLAEFRSEEPRVPIPEDLKDFKWALVFGNIEDIYNWHKDFFLKSLHKHRDSPSDLAKIFLNSTCEFHMYAKYANNKPMSEYLVNEHFSYFEKVRKKLGHKLMLSDYLMNPVQRMPRYELFLSKFKKLLPQLQTMEEACAMAKDALNNINGFTTLQGLKNYDGKVSEQGTLIAHDYLECRHDGKKKRYYVFLFKRLMIFTVKHDCRGKYGMPTYHYKLEIPMNRVQLKELPNKRFILKYTTPSRQEVSIVCQDETDDPDKSWVEKIKKQLLLQETFILNLFNPPSCDDEEEILL